ncbi:MAG TPA: sulfite oxidase-like oxidoreductase [Thermoplasmata archaeon]|nr:sulfite oxidase-like oxidoreductase [Thermoplasmata archaeon]HLA46176.1 sulfite oxidase-like oxidoreductase [Thermoplasmata archaeon]
MRDRPLPPGQHLTRGWPRLDLGIVPRFDPNTWTLKVDGGIENPLTLTWAQFTSVPTVSVVSDFHCVTGWSSLDNRWEGVNFRTLVDLVRPKPETKHVVFTCGDAGYTTNAPLDILLDPDVLLATRHNGGPLPLEHGGPMRLVVPKRYGWKSAKWVRQITFLERDEPGYWEVRGYSNTADPLKEDRYAF